jgi:hypothetical protein
VGPEPKQHACDDEGEAWVWMWMWMWMWTWKWTWVLGQEVRRRAGWLAAGREARARGRRRNERRGKKRVRARVRVVRVRVRVRVRTRTRARARARARNMDNQQQQQRQQQHQQQVTSTISHQRPATSDQRPTWTRHELNRARADQTRGRGAMQRSSLRFPSRPAAGLATPCTPWLQIAGVVDLRPGMGPQVVGVCRRRRRRRTCFPGQPRTATCGTLDEAAMGVLARRRGRRGRRGRRVGVGVGVDATCCCYCYC